VVVVVIVLMVVERGLRCEARPMLEGRAEHHFACNLFFLTRTSSC
jgi:hypothetical protein